MNVDKLDMFTGIRLKTGNKKLSIYILTNGLRNVKLYYPFISIYTLFFNNNWLLEITLGSVFDWDDFVVLETPVKSELKTFKASVGRKQFLSQFWLFRSTFKIEKNGLLAWSIFHQRYLGKISTEITARLYWKSETLQL